MRQRRVFIDTELNVNDEITLSHLVYNQVFNVLRLTIEDKLVIFNGKGIEAPASFIAKTKKAATIRIDAVNNKSVESDLPIHLGQVLSKNAKMDIIIQKATELGVQDIYPLEGKRNVVKIKTDRLDNKMTHWLHISASSCSQCERNILPNIHPPANIDTWITDNNENNTDNNDNTLNIIFTPTASQGLLEFSKTITTKPDKIRLLIGPEGGLTDDEIEFAEQNNFTALRLGPRVLRAETAAITAIANLQLLFGDLN